MGCCQSKHTLDSPPTPLRVDNTCMQAPSPFTDVPGALEEFRAGRMIVVVDDEDRENEGDLTLAAEFVTPEAINFMARYGRGLICLTMTEERADYLRLGPMTQQNSSRFGTAFTETIEAREGVTKGISAEDRSHTRLPSSRPPRRRPCPRWTDRSLCRSRPPRRPHPRRGHLRNHERRRHH